MKDVTTIDKETFERYAQEVSAECGRVTAEANIDAENVLLIGLILANALADIENKIFKEEK